MLRKLSMVLVVVVLLSGVARAQEGPVAGSDGIGDPYFPQLGNGGYDVQHYTLDLTVDVAQDSVAAVVTIDAVSTEALRTFNLDFAGPEITQVTLDGQPVEWDRQDHELIVMPPTPLAAAAPFTVVVSYSGAPQGVRATGIPFLVGWNDTGSGVFVASEPAGAAGWYPVNDHPLDKATYTYRITVPEGYIVAANGVLEDTLDHGDTVTYLWEERHPLASYLATVEIGDFVVQTSEGPDGLPIRNYIPPQLAVNAEVEFSRTADMIAFYNDTFGPYPFEAYGVVVVNTDLSFALETQTLTLFGSNWVSGTGRAEEGVAHELAHQWYGDSVSLARWSDIWLNEGFATYASWLWFEHDRGAQMLDEIVRNAYHGIAQNQTTFSLIFSKDTLVSGIAALVPDDATYTAEQAGQVARLLLADDQTPAAIDALVATFPADLTGQDLKALVESLDFEQVQLNGAAVRALDAALGVPSLVKSGYQFPQANYVPPGNPPVADLFNGGVYIRGALTLHALRLRVGDDAFFTILRTYYDRYQYSNATTADFIGVAEDISGQDLGDLFDAWLYAPTLPDLPEMGLSAPVS